MQGFLDRFGFVRVLAMAPEIGDVQKSCAVKTDLDECRLHARQYAAYLAKIDVADQSAARPALYVQFLDDALLQNSDPRFLGRQIDENFAVHVVRSPNEASRHAVS